MIPKPSRLLSLACLGFLALALAACQPPEGDYGDAPDNEPTNYRIGPNPADTAAFPSFYNSDNLRSTADRGIVHLSDAPTLRFASAYDREDDAQTVDNDGSDDGQPTLVINGFGSAASLAVTLSGSGAPDGEPVSGFLNVLLDLNQDGRWANHQDGGATVTEWVAQNVPVTVPSGSFERVAIPGFAFGPNSARAEFWGRLTVTTVPIVATAPEGWDGSGPRGGFADGETEDFFFGCEGALRIDYPDTADDFADRLSGPNDAPIVTTIRVTNLASETLSYVFSARAQVGRSPAAGNIRYTDLSDIAPEFTVTLNVAGAPANPNPKNLPPQGLLQITLAPSAVATITVTFVPNPNDLPVVLDPTRPPAPYADNRVGRLLFHPLGPCLLRLQKTNDEPVYVQWP